MKFAPKFLLALLLCAGSLAAGEERDDISVETTAGETVKLLFLADGIVRVTAWPKGGREPGPGYVVTMKGESPKIDAHQDLPGVMTLTSATLQASVDLKTGAVTFADSAGHPLLKEQGRRFTPAMVNKEQTFQVQQAFAAAPDESIFGLGQHQDGLWNWRGLPVAFQQQNTVVAIPFYVSTKGYGLLWDNAARGTFNPVDQKIPLTLENADAASTGSQPKATEDLAKPAKPKTPSLAIRHGAFTTGAAGEYVFFAENGDRRNEFTILVDDKPVASVVNTWVPYTLTGTVNLPANTTVKVTLRGGGAAPTLGARPRETGQTVFRSDVGDAVNYVFFQGERLDDVIAGYRKATGAAPLLPRWAYGFWQCRERYNTQQEVLEAAAKYRQLHIPLDVIVQDWQYWGKYGWGAYQWDETRYPDPAAMIKDLHGEHVKFVISIWPNPAAKSEAGAALKALPHGLIGGYYDPFNPEARRLRWSYVRKAFFDIGADGWWQDAAEPGDEGTSVYGHDTFLGSGDRNALAYPLFHSEGIYENQRATSAEKRVMNLTRSAYTGEQRSGAAVWSGDINGDWITFRRQIPAGLNFSLSGLPYWTTDSGGFFRPPNRYKDEDSNEIQARWFQWSTFCPLQRIHGYQTHTEFWNWLPRTQDVLVAYDKLRYRMLPYNYSVAWQVTHRSGTILRALAMDFPRDPKAVATSSEYLFGPAFLVCPITQPKAVSWPVYLPEGARWINFWTGETLPGGAETTVPAPFEQIPLFVRAGAIVPFGPELQYTSEKPADPIDLRIYPGADGDFTLYEDEGDSYRYENGAFSTIPMHWDDAKRTLTLGGRAGEFPGMLKSRTFRVTVAGPTHGAGTDFDNAGASVITYDGRAQDVLPH